VSSLEIRDPIHTFVRLEGAERRILDSRPVQRLRHIHQLAMTSLVYPGATHRRFEHSLGAMELAGRIFDSVTRRDKVRAGSASMIVPTDPGELDYWRRAVRAAALCHDIGHLPFSHAAEDELLPTGWDHERMTVELIRSTEMARIWDDVTPPLRVDDLVKLAVGAKKAGIELTDWEAILAEIIIGDAFGADRMDYLLRDSWHTGVVYGHFDHHRLIDTLRILPQAGDDSEEPILGVEDGGLHSAEALLLARYFMFTQVFYFHPVRRIYDLHLKDFLREHFGMAGLPVEPGAHLALTDNEVSAAILAAARSPSRPGHHPARRLIERDHFRVVYRRNPLDLIKSPKAVQLIFEAMVDQFGHEQVKLDSYPGKGGPPDFPVLMHDERIVSSMALSDTLKTLPVAAFDFIFAAPEIRDEARAWLTTNREEILRPIRENKEESYGEV
jgi:uncharacterized protein